MAYPERRRSNWWFLLPILFSVVGGVITFFILRRDDPSKARNCLYLGAALTAIGIILQLAIVETMPVMDPGFDVGV